MNTKVGASIGPVVTGLPQAVEQQQVQRQQRPEATNLQVGFTKDSGAKVVADGSKVQNPILDGDEHLPAFEDQAAKSMKGLATKLALQLEDFGSRREGGSGLGQFAQFVLGQNNTPTEAGVARLQAIKEQAAPQLPEGSLPRLRASMAANLGVSLPEDATFGQLSLVAGLATAGGDPAALFDEHGTIQAERLAGELARVVRQGGEAIGEAMGMLAGINQQVGQMRTMIPKR